MVAHAMDWRDGARRDWLRQAAALAAGTALGCGQRIATAAAVAAEAPGPATGTSSVSDAPFRFGLIGDTPYSAFDRSALRGVLAAMADEPLEFVLHAGDIKSSRDACSDALLEDHLALIDRCAHPLLLTPGDNEWTDCGSRGEPTASGGPLERLAWLRRSLYARPKTLGARRMPLEARGGLEAQGNLDTPESASPRLPENLRWRIGTVQFCTLHVVGSNNAHWRSPALARAWSLRQEANARWLADTVTKAIAIGARGLVIAMHANPRFRPDDPDRADGWRMMRQLIAAAATAFRGPVLLMHGDTHWFRHDQPLLASHGLGNLHRVECQGSPLTSSWVDIRWNASPVAPAFDVTLRPV